MVKRRLKVDFTEAIRVLGITPKGVVTTGFLGNYKSAVRGKGLEFDGYRKYDQADDAELIDWKASVRANQILVKQYIEERNLQVFFLVDASSSMISASTPKLKIEYVAEIVASLAYVILHAGDAVGMALYTNKAIKEISVGTGMEQFFAISEALVDPDNYGGLFDFSNALKYCIENLKPMTLLIVISDFITIGSNWETFLKMASEKFDLIGFMVRDPIDQSLPKVPGQVLVEDTYSGEKMVIEPSLVAGEYEYEAKREIKEVHDSFRETNADFLKFETTERFVEPIIRMFNERRARWRT